jgi:hypothetical protein
LLRHEARPHDLTPEEAVEILMTLFLVCLVPHHRIPAENSWLRAAGRMGAIGELLGSGVVLSESLLGPRAFSHCLSSRCTENVSQVSCDLSKISFGLRYALIYRPCGRRMASSVMLRHVALIRADVSEERSASFIRVTKIRELGTTLAVTSNRRRMRRNTKLLTLYFFAACVGC